MASTPSLSPREWHQRAIAAEQRGAKDEAERIIAQGLGEHPNEAPLHDSAGNFAMRRGEYGLAAERFAAAARLSPGHLPFAINLAIAQTQADAPEAAQFKWRASCEWKDGTFSHSTVEGFFGLGEEQARTTVFNFDADHPL